MSSLYERILEQTERLDITGKQLGELLGLKKSPLTDWKNHKSNPTLDQLVLMCDIFAISSDYLLFGKDNGVTKTNHLSSEKKISIITAENLSADQQELINTYEKLDRRGQHRVHTIIYEELDRMEKNAETSVSRSIS